MTSYLCLLFLFAFVNSEVSNDYWIGDVDGYDIYTGRKQMSRPVMVLNRGNRQNPQRPTLNRGFQPNLNNQGFQQPNLITQGFQQPAINTQGTNNQGFLQPIPNNQGFQQPNINTQGFQQPNLNTQGLQQPNLNTQGFQQPAINTQAVNNQGFLQTIPNNQGFQQPNSNTQGLFRPNPNQGGQQAIPNQGFLRQNPNQGFQRTPPDTLNLFNIERPCAVENVDCIRRYLAQESGCTPVNGVVGKFIMRKEYFDVPHSNISFTVYNAEITGLDSGKIKEFYMNKKTDNLILEVEFGKISVYSPKTEIRYYRKGREPLEGEDFTNIEFNQLSLTLIVRHVHDENLTESHVYSHLAETVPQMTGGPGLVNIKGLTRQDLKWIDEIGLSAREALLKQGPIYLSAYMQSSICDFRR